MTKLLKDIGDCLATHICAALESEVGNMLAAKDRPVHEHDSTRHVRNLKPCLARAVLASFTPEKFFE